MLESFYLPQENELTIIHPITEVVPTTTKTGLYLVIKIVILIISPKHKQQRYLQYTPGIIFALWRFYRYLQYTPGIIFALWRFYRYLQYTPGIIFALWRFYSSGLNKLLTWLVLLYTTRQDTYRLFKAAVTMVVTYLLLQLGDPGVLQLLIHVHM